MKSKYTTYSLCFGHISAEGNNPIMLMFGGMFWNSTVSYSQMFLLRTVMHDILLEEKLTHVYGNCFMR